MTIIRILTVILLLLTLTPAKIAANPTIPTAASLAWNSLIVQTAEGVDVWLRIDVLGAQPTENINLQYTYTTVANTATANDDYVPATAVAGAITGNTRVALIKIDIKRNQYYEPHEQFYVRLNANSANTVISGTPRLTVVISRARAFYPAFAHWQACEQVEEPSNNVAISAGFIALNGGWCHNDFLGETSGGHDYYVVIPSRNGVLDLQLKNTTPNQHDLQLYIYRHDGGTNYTNIGQSTNPNQQDESIIVQISANTSYLISVFWATATNSATPSYSLKADFQ